MERIRQIIQAFTMTRERDPRLVPYSIAAAVVGLLLALLLGQVLFSSVILTVIFALLLVPLAVLFVFGRRMQRLQNEMLDGQPGAPAAVVQQMRGWHMTPVVAVTRKQDMVHRAVGPGGVVLIGEGQYARVKSLVAQERKKHDRIAGDVTVSTVIIGDGRGETVEVTRLRMHLMKMPRVLKKDRVREVHVKLEAVAPTNIPNPKGALPQQRRGMPR